ncbi:MAG TPA: GGDEF domain-containing protein [Baekduia sp.]|nr:GGDEF domain-containing protein [Baekduia sp.]
MADLPEREREESEVTDDSRRDLLTGLMNDRGFEDELDRAVAFARRYSDSAAVVALDVDGFAGLNDVLGRAAADVLLQQVADALRGSLRGTDVVARLDGDKFAVILNRTGAPDSVRIAEKLRAVVEMVGTAVGSPTRATVSIGVADIAPGTSLVGADVLQMAYNAVSESKAAGRNRVTYAGQTPAPTSRPD